MGRTPGVKNSDQPEGRQNLRTLDGIHQINMQRYREYVVEVEETKTRLHEVTEQLGQVNDPTRNLELRKLRVELEDKLSDLNNDVTMRDYPLLTSEIMDKYYKLSNTNVEQRYVEPKDSRSILNFFRRNKPPPEEQPVNSDNPGAGTLYNAYLALIDPENSGYATSMSKPSRVYLPPSVRTGTEYASGTGGAAKAQNKNANSRKSTVQHTSPCGRGMAISHAATLAVKSDPEAIQMLTSKINDRPTLPPVTSSSGTGNMQLKQKCQLCQAPNTILMINDGYILCPECGLTERIIIDHDKPSYKSPPKEISYFCYKRSNHLNECINQIQGKETTEIPEEVYDKILYELKKQRFTNMAKLTYTKLREILKKLNLSSYYEHIPYIMHRLNGRQNPVIDTQTEMRIHEMFAQIQEPFLRHMPPDRTNMLSYPYFMYKFFELLERDDLLPCLNLLKTREKLMEQDEIWRKICHDCGWQFIRTTVRD